MLSTIPLEYSRVKRLLATAQAGGASEDPVLHLMMAQTCLGLGTSLLFSFLLLYLIFSFLILFSFAPSYLILFSPFFLSYLLSSRTFSRQSHFLILMFSFLFFFFFFLGELEECSKEAQKVIVRYSTTNLTSHSISYHPILSHSIPTVVSPLLTLFIAHYSASSSSPIAFSLFFCSLPLSSAISSSIFFLFFSQSS